MLSLVLPSCSVSSRDTYIYLNLCACLLHDHRPRRNLLCVHLVVGTTIEIVASAARPPCLNLLFRVSYITRAVILQRCTISAEALKVILFLLIIRQVRCYILIYTVVPLHRQCHLHNNVVYLEITSPGVLLSWQ